MHKHGHDIMDAHDKCAVLGTSDGFDVMESGSVSSAVLATESDVSDTDMGGGPAVERHMVATSSNPTGH